LIIYLTYIFREVEQVLNFAQSNLTEKCADISPDLFNKLEQTYALLAFDNPESSPFGYLMVCECKNALNNLNLKSLNQRNMLAYEVNEAILAALHKPSISRLEQLYRLMVWNQHQLKTKGDGRQLTKEAVEEISRGLFAREDDPIELL